MSPLAPAAGGQSRAGSVLANASVRSDERLVGGRPQRAGGSTGCALAQRWRWSHSARRLDGHRVCCLRFRGLQCAHACPRLLRMVSVGVSAQIGGIRCSGVAPLRLGPGKAVLEPLAGGCKGGQRLPSLFHTGSVGMGVEIPGQRLLGSGPLRRCPGGLVGTADRLDLIDGRQDLVRTRDMGTVGMGVEIPGQGLLGSGPLRRCPGGLVGTADRLDFIEAARARCALAT